MTDKVEMTKTGVATASGSAHPYRPYFGFDLPEVQGLFEEHEKLAEKAREAQARLYELEEELKAEQGKLPLARAEDMRAGKKPRTEHIERLEGQIEELREELADIRGAAALVEADVQGTLKANREKYLEQVAQLRAEAEDRVHRLQQELAAEEWEFTAADRLERCLTRESLHGGHSFAGIGPRPKARP
jgi:hypothetical protein